VGLVARNDAHLRSRRFATPTGRQTTRGILLWLRRVRFPCAADDGSRTGQNIEAVSCRLSIHRASRYGARLLVARSRCPRQTGNSAGLGTHLRHAASASPTVYRLIHRLDLRTNLDRHDRGHRPWAAAPSWTFLSRLISSRSSGVNVLVIFSISR